jgi:hypothetical protein
MKTKVILLLLSIALLGCKKESGEATSATITIYSPELNEVIAFGEEVHVEGTIVADGEIHGYKVYLRDEQGNDLLNGGQDHVHGDAFAIHEHWTNTVSVSTQVTVLVEVLLNHKGDKESKQVSITCLPQ